MKVLSQVDHFAPASFSSNAIRSIINNYYFDNRKESILAFKSVMEVSDYNKEAKINRACNRDTFENPWLP